jgi:hypothetical protein
MSPEELLKINGNFDTNSLLMQTARELHLYFVKKKIEYVIIGGLAVIRNNAVRTTCDIDILMGKNDWLNMKKDFDPAHYQTGYDTIINLDNGITIDLLFKEDDWNMIIPFPDPKEVAEYDNGLGANFIGLYDLIEMKIAIYLSKKKEDGIEIASKDLYDVVELIKNNEIDVVKTDLFDKKIRKEFIRIYQKIKKINNKY